VPLLGINNTHGNFNKTNLYNAWWDLMQDPNAEVKQLAYDLVRYAIQTTGFKTTPTGFVDIVPPQFWRESGLAAYSSSITQAYSEGAKSIIPADAAKVVIRHIYGTTSLVKVVDAKFDGDKIVSERASDFKTEKEGDKLKIVEFTAKKGSNLMDPKAKRVWSQYAKIYDRNVARWRLYERQDGSTVYKEIQPLGERNRFTEFTTDPNKVSVVPAYKDLKPYHLEFSSFNQEEGINSDMQAVYDSYGLFEY
jgi:hypothetical protein